MVTRMLEKVLCLLMRVGLPLMCPVYLRCRRRYSFRLFDILLPVRESTKNKQNR